MLMRFHYSLGVGHMYSHEARAIASAQGITTTRLDDEHSETEEILQTTTDFQDPEDEEHNHVGVEEVNLFGQEQNGSTDSLVQALEEMYTDHVFDYED